MFVYCFFSSGTNHKLIERSTESALPSSWTEIYFILFLYLPKTLFIHLKPGHHYFCKWAHVVTSISSNRWPQEVKKTNGFKTTLWNMAAEIANTFFSFFIGLSCRCHRTNHKAGNASPGLIRQRQTRLKSAARLFPLKPDGSTIR